MTTSPCAISCLICTHRAPDSIDLLFASLQFQEWEPGDEVILIDNGLNRAQQNRMRHALETLQHRGV